MRTLIAAASAAAVFAFTGPASAQVRGLPDFTQIVDSQGAAVVNISTTQQRQARRANPQVPQLDENDPFYEFFRRFVPRGARRGRASSSRARSAPGSSSAPTATS